MGLREKGMEMSGDREVREDLLKYTQNLCLCNT